ncbi:DUF1330 domain-containing protein [Dinghuibacter silviterrae]|uniref:Uncharacterized protein DUF1330 n=1 Tax=Dinghuibacter silviterrae TaxID=1539049 RepID=A0A4R8DV95_9BACT|nr:DUF1330 domain-containing protein [Dinghuibacter silviterrae]TDX02334.1 uncharacterized protein DUF1330 [Dinghuibacter silviterrae]
MIYITQLIYLHPGEEASFDAFEAVAIPLIARYNGTLLFRIRPAFIEGDAPPPHEVHLVSFPTEADFEAFGKDPERKAVLHLKERSVERIVLIKGNAL